ncbi:MAG: hypothetical protein WAO09_02110 [Candidatus Dormiibacterota bacterium]|jgi:hypothetical protein
MKVGEGRGYRRKFALAALAAVIAAGGMVAFAFFTAAGTGTGNGVVGTSTAWLVSSSAHTGGPLYPGSGSESIPFTVTNQSPGNQALTSITSALTTDGAGGVYDVNTSSFNDACLASWFTVTNTTPTLPDDLAGTAPGPAGTYGGTATLTMQDFPMSQNACQGVDPQITITVN